MEHGVDPPKRLTNDASVRLVCLPFAGGGSAPYYRWRRHVPAWIELAPVTLPGHDGRLAEPPLTDLRTLVELLVDDLQPTLDKPFVLLGHSMGAWLAFEMARELRRRRRGCRSCLWSQPIVHRTCTWRNRRFTDCPTRSSWTCLGGGTAAYHRR